MKHFKIDDVEVDVARCSIRKAGNLRSVEPKSMAVLQYLALHQQQVISQETLFNALWPNRTFNPGSVQRCIAQLRKALDDDSKHPTYIKTHPKRGYSLGSTPVEVGLSSYPKLIMTSLLVLTLVLLLVVGLSFFQREQGVFEGQLTPITRSSHYDFYPHYSPNGQRLAFVRQQGEQSHIYLKEGAVQQARRLSSRSDDYQALTWARDGKGMFYVVRDKNGDRVEYLSTEAAYGISPKKLFNLKSEGRIWKIQHYQQSLIYMHAFVPLNQAPTTQIMLFDLQTNSEKVLLENTQTFTPYRISLSPDQKTLAIAGENAVNQIEVRLLDLTNQSLGQPIKSLDLGFTEISWHPNANEILLHHMNKLYLLDLDGQMRPLPYQHYQNLYNPQFHPDASHIVFSMTEQDQDIYLYDAKNNQFSQVVESSGEDRLARLSPSSDAIAFVSSRSGHQQVYIQHKSQLQLIFANQNKALIYRAPVWSADGKTLVFSAGTSLYFYQVELNMLTVHTFGKQLTGVLDWYRHSEHLLIVLKNKSFSEFAKYNIISKKSEPIATSGVNPFARLDSKDQLVFAKDRQALTLKKAQLTPTFTVALSNNTAVFPSEKGMIFQQQRKVFRLSKDGQKELITTVPENLMYLTDVSLDGNLWLFSSNNQQTAKIVSLH